MLPVMRQVGGRGMSATGSTATGARPPDNERRGRNRLPVLMPGTIVCEDGARFHCVVRDISSTGARIGIARKHRLPERFRLVTPNSASGYPMRRAWQRGDFAGLMLALTTGAGSTAPG